MPEISALLDKLYQGSSLSQAESYTAFYQAMQGTLTPVQLSSFLTALKIKGETPDEIAGAASAMIANAAPFSTPDYDFSDIVGTGGDGHNTINISSASALLAAACGLKVAKHGNKSVSSKSGSADLFRELGIKPDISPSTARQCLDEANFCFLFAPVYHSGMRHAAPVRSELKTRTIFNVLGPLANPARPTHGVYGVYSPNLLKPYAQTLMLLGLHRGLIVHGEGLDEFALHGESQVIDVEHGDIREYSVSPEDFGLSRYPLSAIEGGEPQENKKMILDALAGEGSQAHRAALAMNTGALLKVAGTVNTFNQGAELAMDAMQSGKALSVIEKVATISNQEK